MISVHSFRLDIIIAVCSSASPGANIPLPNVLRFWFGMRDVRYSICLFAFLSSSYKSWFFIFSS